MSGKISHVGIFLVSILWASGCLAGKLGPEAVAKAKSEGSVRVLVMLNDESRDTIVRKSSSRRQADVHARVTAVLNRLQRMMTTWIRVKKACN